MSAPKSAAQTNKHPTAPINLFEQQFCQFCEDKTFCNTNANRKRTCVFTLIAKNLAALTQIADEFLTRYLLEKV